MSKLYDIKGICFLDQIIDSSVAVFEFLNTNFENQRPEEIAAADKECICVDFKDFKDNLIERYYYRFMITDNEAVNGIKLSKHTYLKIFTFLNHRDKLMELESDLWITFELDLNITKLMINFVNIFHTKVKRIEEVSYFLLNGSEKEDMIKDRETLKNDWARKMGDNKLKLEKFLVENQNNNDNVITILKELIPFFKSKSWLFTDNDDEQNNEAPRNLPIILRNNLNGIKDILEVVKEREENQKNLPEAKGFNNEELNMIIRYQIQLLSLPSLGISSVSTILHCLWADRFVLYNPIFSTYMSKLGFEIKNYMGGKLDNTIFFHEGHEVKNIADVLHYNDYNKEILQLVKTVNNFADNEPRFDESSYYIKKEFDIFSLLI